MTDNETNLTLLNVNQIVSLLSRAYIKLIKNGTPLKSFPSVMLWGPPGIGKSQGVREIAGNIQAKTGKKVSITDVRLLLFNPVDLRGIPTTNADKTLSVWLKPQIFQMDESEDVINILFLDEITAAPQSVQAAAYQITLDRVIGEHKLPENCIVIAAGNRVTDKSVAYNMPRALANRLLHITVKGDPDSWHDWAVKSGIHRFVTSFLEYNPTALMRSDSPESTLLYYAIIDLVSGKKENVLQYLSAYLDEKIKSLKTESGIFTAEDFTYILTIRCGYLSTPFPIQRLSNEEGMYPARPSDQLDNPRFLE